MTTTDHTHADGAPRDGLRVIELEGDEPYVMRLREEQLHAEARPEQAGLVRIVKQVTERTETVEVPVREERLVITRVPGSGRVIVDDRELAAGETIEITTLRETVHVSKEVVAREDIAIRREQNRRVERVTETLRREEIDVEHSGDLLMEERRQPDTEHADG